jgi:uncharacterized protein (TIGR03067 family)
MRYGCLLLVFVLGCSNKPGASVGTVKDDQAALQGTWRPIDAIEDGEKIPDAEKHLAKATVEFVGNRVVFKVNGEIQEINQITLDPKAEPKAIDLTVIDENGLVQKLYDAENRAVDWIRRGIYVIEGDLLKVCTPDSVGVPRPDKFDALPGTGLTVMTFQKVR